MATKRLIDANELKKALRTAKGADAVGHSTVKFLKIDTIIEEAVTVDAVEVVRCKDCKYGIWDDEEEMWKCVYDSEFDEQYGEYFGFVEYNDGEHFCSCGERKDND